ncbi:uncharacterized protein isoform X2 [Leptinotarsa decemlineata]|uniref:uncharacterized protein isoform X2 n=1 Tax=Leptinotarsa decemlineata TaxID=7539 RepID=UPI003D30A962
MKIYFILALVAVFAFTTGVFVPPRPGHKKHNLGSERCTWGPGYWCKNLTTAGGCHAVRHCIDTVWVHQKLPPDTSSVCQICLDMVKEARDNLESNETQDLIKQVFEGTCKLIHLKPIVKECDKIADNFIPELIDTLASQMNPQVVCSVAGLCNNQRVQELLAEESSTKVAPVDPPNKCDGCHKVVNVLEENFSKMTRDEVLHSFLWYCGKFGSFSDGCSNIVITYFTEIYNHLQEHLNPNEVCLLSGECSAQFHTHEAKVEITPMSHIGYVPVNAVKEDLPCDLCEQLVKHLKDLLIANTTELEFKQVLEGLCKQTGKFAEECGSLVEQYYSEIYNYLVNGLDSKGVCADIGICNATGKEGGIIAPLLPLKTSKLAASSKEQPPLVHVKLNQDTSSVRILPNPQQQLPIDLLMPPHTQILYNKEVCVFCEYFLHEVQVAITDPKTEENIKEVIDKACDKLPSSINATCVQFVDSYEPALVALLAQEIDPSQICPLIKACPSSGNRDVEIFMQAEGSTKCPLCLLTVTKLEYMGKSVKTKKNIENALDELCLDLPSNMVPECEDFVNTYTEELVELIISDLKPDEVCVFLKLCQDDKPASPLPRFVIKHLSGNIETNVIPDDTINGQIIGIDEPVIQDKPQCVICQFVMKEIEEKLKDKKTDDDIENIVKNICKIMPSTIKTECNSLVDEYGDLIIQLLISSLEPKEICTRINLCASSVEIIREPIPNYTPIGHRVDMQKPVEQDGPQCVVCQFIMKEIQDQLKNNKTDNEIENIVREVCHVMPTSIKTQCDDVIDEYGDAIIQLLIAALEPDEICSMIKLCSSYLETVRVKILECPICEMTVEVMEKILSNPRADHAVEHVLEKTCRGLPIQYRSKCVEMIEKYGDTMISLLIHYTNRDTICKSIGYCKTTLNQIVID